MSVCLPISSYSEHIICQSQLILLTRKAWVNSSPDLSDFLQSGEMILAKGFSKTWLPHPA